MILAISVSVATAAAYFLITFYFHTPTPICDIAPDKILFGPFRRVFGAVALNTTAHRPACEVGRPTMTSIEYFLTVGGLVVGFLAMSLMLVRALSGASEIEGTLMALPF
jgi:hypothetical protein